MIWIGADTLKIAEEKVGEMIPFTLEKGPEGKQVSGSFALMCISSTDALIN